MKKVTLDEVLNKPLFPIMWKLGWPVMISSILETVYHLADTFWLGHLPQGESGNAVAGLQLAFPSMWFLISFASGFAMAGVALVSQYTGARENEKANQAASQVVVLSLIFGVVLGFFGFIFIPFLINLLTNAKELTSVANVYLKVIFLGFPFMFLNGIFRSVMVSYGDTLTPMYVAVFTNILNIFLDPVLIFGLGPFPKMGIVGAAVATIFSMFIASLIAMFYLMSGKRGIHVKREYLKPNWEWIKKIFRIGLPAAIGQSAEAFGFVVLTGIIGRLHNARVAIAAYGIGDRLLSFSFIAIDGLATGLTTIIGQSLGADRVDRASFAAKRGMFFMFIVLCIETFILVLFRRQLVMLFIPNEFEIIEEGGRFMLYFAPAIPMFGVIRGIMSAFQASGHNTPNMIISFLRLWGLRVPLSYIFGFTLKMNSTGVWIGMTISNFITALVATSLFLKGGWKKKVIEEKREFAIVKE
ncbi:MAG: MATE family efflux transporter [Caldisericia bacterium]|nr:MATE family efflux transporter [Caldisericia bacterium]